MPSPFRRAARLTGSHVTQRHALLLDGNRILDALTSRLLGFAEALDLSPRIEQILVQLRWDARDILDDNFGRESDAGHGYIQRSESRRVVIPGWAGAFDFQ